MKELTWKKEEVYVARDEHGIAIRFSETDPETWVEEYLKGAKKDEGDKVQGQAD